MEKFEISGNEVIDSITFLTNTVVELVSSSSQAEVYQSLIDKACSQAKSREILDHDMEYTYKIYDKDGQFYNRFTVKKAYCKSSGKK